MKLETLTPFMLFWLGLNVAAKAAKQPQWTFSEARGVWESRDVWERTQDILDMATDLNLKSEEALNDFNYVGSRHHY